MAPISCIVAFCTKRGTFSFPQNEILRAEWIKAIEQVKPLFEIGTNTRICGDHFKSSDFTRRTTFSLIQPDKARRRLKKNVVPSIFSWKTYPTTQVSTSQDPIFPNDIKTYSKNIVPPIFVEEQKNFFEGPENVLEDPLKLTYETSECNIEIREENVDNTHLTAWEIDVTDFEIPVQEQENMFETQAVLSIDRTNKVENSAQTENINHGFCLHLYKDDDRAVHMFTGLENYNKLMLVFNSLGPCAYKLTYFYGLPPKNLTALEHFFITLLILRRHESMEMIATMYRITVKQVYNIFITWIRFMALQWKNLDIWVPRKNVKDNMPFDFHDKYPSTRLILDVTECPIKKPRLPLAQQVTFSTYKNRNTIKFLVGITPNGFISYVSSSYGGSVTDRQLIERSSILTRFDYNDEIMVDKGLNVQDIFLPYGVKVNMPAYFKKGNQIAPETLKATRRIASKRVHVERVIGLLKTYKILSQPMNHTETLLSSDIVFVCAMLINFRSGIIDKFA